jgi:thiosulfate dehydrogenase
LLCLLLLSGTLTLASATQAVAQPVTFDLTRGGAPDIASVPDDPFGRMVRYGYALFTDSANQIGPRVADPALRYAGNNMSCQSCHLKGGTQPYAMPLIGVWGVFPQYRGREGAVVTLEVRINGCLERSMNGRSLPLGSPAMTALASYMRWLSGGVPVGAKLTGAGILPIAEPARAADPKRGAQVFADTCAACHKPDGSGQPAETGLGYQFPPLWGPDSFNDGAGMSRLLTFAAFAKSNMPAGATYDNSVLTDEDAYDVAAYVLSQSRPAMANLDRDYPNRLQKPIDTAYGPYGDGIDAAQHRFGPFGPIRARLAALAAEARIQETGSSGPAAGESATQK